MCFVAAGHHDGGEAARQQLVQRQDQHLHLGGRRRNVAGGFQALAHPGGKIAGAEAALGQRPVAQSLLRGGVQVQGSEQSLAGDVILQRLPLAGALQGGGQRGQPMAQAFRSLQAVQHSADLLVQRLQGLVWRGFVLARAQRWLALRPASAALLTQACFQAVDQRGVKSRRVLQPVQHLVTAGPARTGTQQTHLRGGGTRGRQGPAGIVAQT